jgi:hypothetical protein
MNLGGQKNYSITSAQKEIRCLKIKQILKEKNIEKIENLNCDELIKFYEKNYLSNYSLEFKMTHEEALEELKRIDKKNDSSSDRFTLNNS